jgi:hypothetical protein
MYMRNKSKYTNYNIDDFPPNYSGQYRKESLRTNESETANEEEPNIHNNPNSHNNNNINNNNNRNNSINKNEEGEAKADNPEDARGGEKEDKEAKRSNSLLGNLFGGNKDKAGKEGKESKGGLLSGLFKGGDSKGGGILSGIEIEDLILLAVIFFLLKDGFEDDLIIILAIILLT